MKACTIFLLVGSVFAQVPTLDQTTLNGKFNFVYGLYQRSSSSAIMGTISFDGKGHYTLAAGDTNAQGVYRIDVDGLGSLSNPFDETLPPINLRIAAGGKLAGGSTLDQSTADRHDLLLALPAATKTPAMAGNWGGVTYLYTPGPPTLFARAGRFRFQFGADGTLSSTTWTYHESDVNSGAPQDLTSTGTYTVDSSGIGMYTSAQGAKGIAVSADGSMYIGIDNGGLPELIFGTRLADGNPSAQGFQDRYWWYQTNAASPGGGSVRSSDFAWTLGNALQGVEGRGLNRGSGWGQFIDAATGRLMDLAVVLGGFTIHPDSTVDLVSAGLGSPGIGVISADGVAIPWTNLSATATGNYSFSIAIQSPTFQAGPGQSVFLDPNGPMQAATASAHPFPFAPGTLVKVRGSGLAAGPLSYTSLPLPTALGATSLTANGQAVGLVAVASDSITFVMPFATAGAGRIRLKATVNGVASNEIAVRAVPSSIGFFSTTGDGVGDIVAAHVDGSPITAASPASANEAIVLYASGLGSMATSVAEYAWPTSPDPTSFPVQVDFAGVQATVLYAGAAPGLPGVYQINVIVPSSATTSSATSVRLSQGYAQTHISKVTIPIR